MFLKNLLLSMFVILTSPCSAEEQERYAIPSIVLNKNTISGLEITERNSSSPSTDIFLYYQIYKPESFSNPFNGTSSTKEL